MNQIAIEDFAKYLAGKNLLPARDIRACYPSTRRCGSVASQALGSDGTLRKWVRRRGGAFLWLEAARRCRNSSPRSSLAARFSPRFLARHRGLPLRISERLTIGSPSPTRAIPPLSTPPKSSLAARLRSRSRPSRILRPFLASSLAVRKRRPRRAERRAARADDDIESLRDLASGAPVVRAVNDMLEKAMELRASDIHIEPFRNGLVVRMRVDGLLRAVAAPVNALPQALISRIKILAGLNIAERRLPQDGAARLRVARSDIDIRVATMPSAAWRIGGDPPFAARSRFARSRQTRPAGARTRKSCASCLRFRMA